GRVGGPGSGDDRPVDRLGARGAVYLGDVQCAGRFAEQAESGIALRIEIDHERVDPLVEGRGCQDEGHRRLADAALEGTHTLDEHIRLSTERGGRTGTATGV